MERTVKALLFTVASFVLLTAQSWAGDYQIVYREQIDGADGFVSVAPILGVNRSFLGTVSADLVNHRVRIIDVRLGAPVDIELHSSPLAILTVPERDTLCVFAATRSGYLFRLDVGDDFVTIDSVELGMQFVDPMACRLTLDTLPDGAPCVLTSATVVDHDQVLDWGEETSYIDFMVAHRLSLEFHDHYQASFFAYANACGDSKPEQVYVRNVKGSSHFEATIDEPAQNSRWSLVHGHVRDESRMLSIDHVTHDGEVTGWYTGWLDSGSPYEELICSGVLQDWHSYRSAAPVVARYRFANGYAEEVWSTEVAEFQLGLVMRSEGQVYGLLRDDAMAVLDLENGTVLDSVSLGRSLSNGVFFVAGELHPSLHLLGRCSDTLIVYQFRGQSESASAQVSEPVPSTFTLKPNHPNPFNSETVIEFENEQSQHLTLKIYNLLGQEIATLHERSTGAGLYQYHWDGKNVAGQEQASGIYFARLWSGSETQLIKMIYLK